MSGDEHKRRDILQAITMLPLLGSLIGSGQARAQTAGTPVKVDTKGLVAKIKFEAPLGGFLTEINGKYKLRVTELTLAPGGHVGEHNHEGTGSPSRPMTVNGRKPKPNRSKSTSASKGRADMMRARCQVSS